MAKKTSVSIDEWLYDQLKAEASHDGMSVSAWLSRLALLEVYRREGQRCRELMRDRGCNPYPSAAEEMAEEAAMLADVHPADRRSRGAA